MDYLPYVRSKENNMGPSWLGFQKGKRIADII